MDLGVVLGVKGLGIEIWGFWGSRFEDVGCGAERLHFQD